MHFIIALSNTLKCIDFSFNISMASRLGLFCHRLAVKMCAGV